ncbi:MAG TPA: helicase-related protein [Spirochaetota bacterium]|nr:helicase-related protein [Spirochaetota bacterium]
MKTIKKITPQISTAQPDTPKTDHIANRNRMVLALRREMMGPAPFGRPVDCSGDKIICENIENLYNPNVQAKPYNEILKGESPHRRYGVGVLYPAGKLNVEDEDPDEPGTMEETPSEEGIAKECLKNLEKIIDTIGSGGPEKETEDFDISLANLARPCSMGISFLAELKDDCSITITAKGGRYRRREAVHTQSGKTALWWLRSNVKITASFKSESILKKNGIIQPDVMPVAVNCDGLNIRIELFSRPAPSDGEGSSHLRLLTACIVNRTCMKPGDSLDENCLFQSRFVVKAVDHHGADVIHPYPEPELRSANEEEQSLRLLYRKSLTFATGHGCAADWDSQEGAIRASAVKAVPFPVFETASITPQIFREDGSELLVSMTPLAGLDEKDNGMSSLEEVVERYGLWIVKKEKEAQGLPAEYTNAARQHLEQCRRCHERMLDGLSYLKTDKEAAKAFQLANHAILLQQIRSFRESRTPEWNEEQKRILFKNKFISPDPCNPEYGRGTWRPFQIAFILMTVRSCSEDSSPDPFIKKYDNRNTVELIWFPTGGGKTEAYLGLTAFALFMRRMKNKEDTGTHVLMRYTLRLLTAQQFQRAAGLICAMEALRRDNEDLLGPHEYSIGIWLGGDTTPNTRQDAIQQYRKLIQGWTDAEYNFVLLRCPWCGAQIGSFGIRQNTGRGRGGRGRNQQNTQLLGLDQRNNTIALHCADPDCSFSKKLPVYVIDEDIYEKPPSLVIGTVDKFAMLAWRPEASALFGIGPDGKRMTSPPGLIIQDELHLITGPLGSMAGLYETVIEELCIDRRNPARPVRPKIISSTATTRRYKEQIKGLYARKDAALFPPPGLDAGDSFFGTYARKSDGTLQRGRLYTGINAPGLGSVLTTNVRVYSSLLQACEQFDDAGKDPWMTLLAFFNSLRELGTSLTLFQADVPERINQIAKKFSAPTRRFLNNVKELTGRISSSEIPGALQELEKVPGKDPYPVDVCLASNIIEVGIDVDRLSLICVAGQPKTTAQYIQVTGRIGRKWRERPGLVVTIYSPGKPRDRSHFEKFRSYHERLYAQVEPSSVTPFTSPALKRALHAVMVAYVRQAGGIQEKEKPGPYPAALIEKIIELMKFRISIVDPQENINLINAINERIAEWQAWNSTEWSSGPAAEMPSLLRYAGMYYPDMWERVSWPTPTSMRSVDAECMPEITQLYLIDNINEIRETLTDET